MPKAREATGKPFDAGAVAAQLQKNGSLEIVVNGVRFSASSEIEAAIRRACESTAALPTEMTTIEAAEFLDVSRPFVVKLIKRGNLPHRLVGSHRRIPTDALVKYRDGMYQRAKKSADEMTSAAEDMGLYKIAGAPPKRK